MNKWKYESEIVRRDILVMLEAILKAILEIVYLTRGSGKNLWNHHNCAGEWSPGDVEGLRVGNFSCVREGIRTE